MSYEENLKSFNADADASIGIYTGVPGQPGSASPNGGKQYCPLRITGKNQVGLNAAKAGVSDGATTSGSPTVTSATGAFTSADVGRPISGAGVPAGATIITINSGTSVAISANATATATGVSLTFGLAATVGVLQNKPQKPGMAATVGHIGITNGLAGAAISAGAEVVPDSTGRFVPGVATSAGLRFISHGIAAAAGELVPLQIV
jgi:hypothetical protein